jgi:hypothetical protein
MIELINSFPDFKGSFGDKRIDKRAAAALSKLTLGRNSSIRQVTESDAEQKSFYRLFNNEKFDEKTIEQSIVNRCGQLCKDRHVLCIQDTTEFNLTGHQGRLKAASGLGKTTKEGILGFMLHSSLVVDANAGSALGYSYIKAWERKEGMGDRHTRGYKQLPIEEKESYKWIEAALQTKQLLQQSKIITIIGDRESDIYDLLAAIPDPKVHLLVRSNFDRKIAEGVTLGNYLSSLPVMHHYNLMVRGDVRKNIEKRTALMELKWDKVSVIKPQSCKNKELPARQQLYVVEAREQNKKGGIYWRIITTHPVTNSQEAMQIIEWYKQRWYIEQVHRLLKTEGFRIERSQLEQGWAIRKLTLLAMMATLRILQMMLAYEDDHEQPIDEIFDNDQQQCLQVMNEKLQGQTDKLKNPSHSKSLKWATWIIARLGGWKGYRSQRKPGPIVLQKGLAKFYHMYEGWLMYQNFSKNVSTQ